MLADAVHEALPQDECEYFGAADTVIPSSELLYIGFWTDKGTCEESLKSFLGALHGKRVELFGTAGFGKDSSYYEKILEAVKASGVKRFLVVGGAGSLFVKPGLRLVDAGTLPEAWLPGVKSLSKFFLETLTAEQELDWVFFSPAANLGNLQKGVRTGKFRLGKDDLIVDEKGDSFISVEDYAMAMVDELEQENHHRERFTIGY